MKKSEQFIPVEKEIRLWTETFGGRDDEAVLLISGAGANSSFWSERLSNECVKQGFFVIRYDHRDCGYSTKINYDQDPFDVMQLTSDAVAILKALKKQKAHVVGHSMGGFIAQLMAIHYPDRVISMISASSSTNSAEVPPPPDETWKIFLRNNPVNDFEKDLKGFRTVWRYLNGTAEFDEKLADDYTRNLYNRQEIKGALGESHVKAQVNLADRSLQLSKINIPALIIHGGEDYLVDKVGGIQTAQSIPNSRLVVIPRMGHMLFNEEIKRIFEDHIINYLLSQKLLKE